jgi:hypothetical protein
MLGRVASIALGARCIVAASIQPGIDIARRAPEEEHENGRVAPAHGRPGCRPRAVDKGLNS